MWEKLRYRLEMSLVVLFIVACTIGPFAYWLAAPKRPDYQEEASCESYQSGYMDGYQDGYDIASDEWYERGYGDGLFEVTVCEDDLAIVERYINGDPGISKSEALESVNAMYEVSGFR